MRLNLIQCVFIICILLWFDYEPSNHLAKAQLTPEDSGKVMEILPVADTYIAQGAPERRRPDLRVFWVGYNLSQGSEEQQSLLSFDLSTLPSASEIASAQLSLHLSSTTSDDAPLAISVNRVEGSWSEDANWAEVEAALANGTLQIIEESATAAVNTAFVEYTWDLTAMIRSWHAGSRDQGELLNLILRGEETTNERERAFWSSECSESDCGSAPGKRPRLTISYTEPLPVPTTAPIAQPTPAPEPTSAPEPAEPAPNIEITVDYKIDGSEPTIEFPTTWQPGQTMNVGLTLSRINSQQPLAGLTITSEIPLGTEFISATQSGVLDAGARTLQWTDLTVPAENNSRLSFTLQKPVPITNPQIVVTETAGINVFMFDAITATGSNLTYEWDFDDGGPTITRPDPFFQMATIQHSFLAARAYEVQLTIYNQACHAVVTRTVTVPEGGGKGTITDTSISDASHSDTSRLPRAEANRAATIKAAANRPQVAAATEDTASLSRSEFQGRKHPQMRAASTIAASEDAPSSVNRHILDLLSLPQCPDVALPTAPQIVARWTEENSDEPRSQFINPRAQLYLPHVALPN